MPILTLELTDDGALVVAVLVALRLGPCLEWKSQSAFGVRFQVLHTAEVKALQKRVTQQYPARHWTLHQVCFLGEEGEM